MTPPADLHLHTALSADGHGSLLDYARRADELGLREWGCAEHVDVDPRNPLAGYLDAERLWADLENARSAFPNQRIHAGLELSFLREHEDALRVIANAHSYNHIIGSVHWMDDALHAPWYAASDINSADLPALCRAYLGHLTAAARCGFVTTVGHLDVPRRYSDALRDLFVLANFPDEFGDLLRAVIEHDVAIEINSAGLRHRAGACYPDLALLREYRRLGGRRLTFGSDAHRPADLARDLDTVMALARAAGF